MKNSASTHESQVGRVTANSEDSLSRLDASDERDFCRSGFLASMGFKTPKMKG
jgi:hypothetical protein